MPKRSPASQSELKGSATELKAPLQSALGSLNITLDEELTRYRRQRQGHPAPLPRRLKVKSQRPLDLITVKPTESSPSQATPTISGAVNIPPPPPPRIPNPAAAETEAEATSPAIAAPSDIEGDESVTALASQHDLSPEGYLASSEALLQSLAADGTADESAAAPSDSTWLDNWATPLGVGSLALLLVGSAGLGYVLTNPTAISHIPLLKRLSATSTAGDVDAELTNTDNLEASDATFHSLGPDLSSQEFVELNLNTLSTLETNAAVPLSPASTTATQPASTPTATAPAAQPPSAAATATAPATAAAPPTSPAPRAATARPAPPPPARPAAPARPAPQPAPTAPARPPAPQSAATAAAAPAPSSTPAPVNYYVVTDYTGDQSLSTARTAVEDAYVRNFSEGARIQMGAFNSAEAAESLAENLQSQGISASVRED
ncbi:SPOR domain-containing protein [Sphaerothrix gracilis]|uniref:SPOR domain-containing protein n=1 Tax=Sphaerothrix gracilis TaxID=3151835 RepID=UPI0031FC0723